ncbi:hypothetical protein S83_058873, partial [Arachis hypogaea]
AEGSEVSAELEFLNQQNLILSMENKALKQRDINKHFPGPHFDPPPKDKVREMMKCIIVWLKYVPGISFRTDNGPFKAAMQSFTQKIVQMMKTEN